MSGLTELRFSNQVLFYNVEMQYVVKVSQGKSAKFSSQVFIPMTLYLGVLKGELDLLVLSTSDYCYASAMHLPTQRRLINTLPNTNIWM